MIVMPRLPALALALAVHCLFFSLQHTLVLGVVPVDPSDVKNTRTSTSITNQAQKKLRLASTSQYSSLSLSTFSSHWTVGDEEESLSFPPIHVDDGLTFTRSIQKLDASFQLHLQEGHCKSHDKYGDNNCHYDWGDQVIGNYTLVSPQLIHEGDTMTGDFRIDQVVPYQFTCNLCGEPCVLEIPVIEVSYSIDMPPCPIGPEFHSRVCEKLNAMSPTGGIRTHLSGTVVLTRATGETIAEFTVSAYVK